MRWRKLGKIFSSRGEHPWMNSHGANPVAHPLGNGIYRIFFNSRDRDNRSYAGYVEIDIADPAEIRALSSHPVLTPGEPGYFDDSGVSLGSLVEHEGKLLLYYVGWNLGTTVPFRNSIGVAAFNETSGTFQKLRRAPVLDRSESDPFNLSYPCVLFDAGLFRMWYGSNLTAVSSTEDMTHVIKYASSKDGFHWTRVDKIQIDVLSEDEVGPCRPSVIKSEDGYRMWYSTRRRFGPYKIGYAESKDGLRWERLDDEVTFAGGQEDWDSEMQCYPSVFSDRGKLYMLYSGNGYGRDGFGLAVAEG